MQFNKSLFSINLSIEFGNSDKVNDPDFGFFNADTKIVSDNPTDLIKDNAII